MLSSLLFSLDPYQQIVVWIALSCVTTSMMFTQCLLVRHFRNLCLALAHSYLLSPLGLECLPPARADGLRALVQSPHKPWGLGNKSLLSSVAWLRLSSMRPCRSAWTPTCTMSPESSMSGWPRPLRLLTCRSASTEVFFSPSSECPLTRNPK